MTRPLFIRRGGGRPVPYRSLRHLDEARRVHFRYNMRHLAARRFGRGVVAGYLLNNISLYKF